MVLGIFMGSEPSNETMYVSSFVPIPSCLLGVHCTPTLKKGPAGQNC